MAENAYTLQLCPLGEDCIKGGARDQSGAVKQSGLALTLPLSRTGPRGCLGKGVDVTLPLSREGGLPYCLEQGKVEWDEAIANPPYELGDGTRVEPEDEGLLGWLEVRVKRPKHCHWTGTELVAVHHPGPEDPTDPPAGWDQAWRSERLLQTIDAAGLADPEADQDTLELHQLQLYPGEALLAYWDFWDGQRAWKIPSAVAFFSTCCLTGGTVLAVAGQYDTAEVAYTVLIEGQAVPGCAAADFTHYHPGDWVYLLTWSEQCGDCHRTKRCRGGGGASGGHGGGVIVPVTVCGTGQASVDPGVTRHPALSYGPGDLARLLHDCWPLRRVLARDRATEAVELQLSGLDGDTAEPMKSADFKCRGKSTRPRDGYLAFQRDDVAASPRGGNPVGGADGAAGLCLFGLRVERPALGPEPEKRYTAADLVQAIPRAGKRTAEWELENAARIEIKVLVEDWILGDPTHHSLLVHSSAKYAKDRSPDECRWQYTGLPPDAQYDPATGKWTAPASPPAWAAPLIEACKQRRGWATLHASEQQAWRDYLYGTLRPDADRSAWAAASWWEYYQEHPDELVPRREVGPCEFGDIRFDEKEQAFVLPDNHRIPAEGAWVVVEVGGRGLGNTPVYNQVGRPVALGRQMTFLHQTEWSEEQEHDLELEAQEREQAAKEHREPREYINIYERVTSRGAWRKAELMRPQDRIWRESGLKYTLRLGHLKIQAHPIHAQSGDVWTYTYDPAAKAWAWQGPGLSLHPYPDPYTYAVDVEADEVTAASLIYRAKTDPVKWLSAELRFAGVQHAFMSRGVYPNIWSAAEDYRAGACGCVACGEETVYVRTLGVDGDEWLVDDGVDGPADDSEYRKSTHFTRTALGHFRPSILVQAPESPAAYAESTRRQPWAAIWWCHFHKPLASVRYSLVPAQLAVQLLWQKMLLGPAWHGEPEPEDNPGAIPPGPALPGEPGYVPPAPQAPGGGTP